jgi:peptidoglycan/xylan/chitin deacetylase (PgdA/CDA1 family)
VYAADFKWPDGAHIAVVFNMSWETWPKTLATAENNQKAGETVGHHAKYARNMMYVYQHAYAETGGMQRLLDVWQRHDIRASCYVDGLNLRNYPALAREAVQHGHELLVQGWDHTFLWEQSAAEQRESVAKTVKVFEEVLGRRPTGYTTAGGTLTPESIPIAIEHGLDYIAAFRNCDVPFIINHEGKRIVGQNSYALTDFTAYGAHDQSPREVITQWRDFFDVLYSEGRRGWPKMLAFGSHPFLAQGHRTGPLEELVGYVKSKPKVWIATRAEIAEWMLKTYPDLDLAAFYPEAVASDQWYGLSLGVGGEEAKAEAARFRRE